MKKQTKMACLVLALAAILSSCKKNENLKSNSEVSSKGSKLVLGDEKWDRLGYGLDVTEDMMSMSSLSDVPILDMERFENDFRNVITAKIEVNPSTEGYDRSFSGATAYDYVRDVSKKFSFGGDFNVKIATTDSSKRNFTGLFKKNTEDQNITGYSSKYSYGTTEAVQRVKRIRFTGDVPMDLLMQYVTPQFVTNVANQTAEQLVARYGTHVMLDISLGGIIRFSYSGVLTNNSNTQTKIKSLNAGLGVVTKLVGINLSLNTSSQEIVKINSEARNRNYQGNYYGGTNGGSSISIDQYGTVAGQNVNLAGFQSSITAKNAVLIDVGRAVFLYDFIADPIKKAQVKAEVERYINSRQITVVEEPPVWVQDPFRSSFAYTEIPWFPLGGGEPVWYPSEQPMLTPGQEISNGQYLFTLQPDGNLVIYRTSNWQVLWSSKTNGKGGNYLYFQVDGNLVLYKNSNYTGVVWSSGKSLTGGNLDGSTRFVFQGDGNLVMQFDGGTYIDVIGSTGSNNKVSSHFGTL